MNGSYQRRKHIIPKKSVYTVEFMGARPNYYRLQNMSNTTIYGATISLPRTDLYDFKAQPKAVGNYCEPTQRDTMYLLNPSSEDAEVILTTWADEFDASFMALSEITLDTDVAVDTNNIIKSFETSLPSGKNVIGKVDLNTTDRNNLSSIASAMIASSGTSYLNNMNKHIVDMCNKMVHDNDIIAILNEIKNKPNATATDLTGVINEITGLSDICVNKTLFYELIDRLCGGTGYNGLINDVVQQLNQINQKIGSSNPVYADTKLVAFNLYKLGDVDCDLSKIPSLAGYTINRILGCSNPDIESSIGIADTVLMASENNTTREVNILPIKVWNELYAGKGKTTLNAWCDVDPLSSQIIIEAVSDV